jgi:TerC family integral membrane protein
LGVSSVAPEIWAVTIAGLVAIVVLDLTVIARRNQVVSMRSATGWVLFYVGLAGLFAAALALWRPESAGEFVAGYITEYSLSVDNLFVFVVIMSRFAVPALAQDKALYIGIVLSLVLRAVFIAAGAAALHAASWVFYLFGAFLVYTATRLALDSGEDDEDFTEGRLVRGLRRVMPLSTDYHGARLTTRTAGTDTTDSTTGTAAGTAADSTGTAGTAAGGGGRRMFTPMALVIAAIGLANVIFALDSIPAIFGLTQDAYIVFTANAFALMGLRQLYFLIGGLLQKLVYLNYGLAVILGFIGVKLLVEALHGSHIDAIGHLPLPDIGTVFSLEFIIGTLLLTTAASLAKDMLTRRQRANREADERPAVEEESVDSEVR